MSVRDDAGMARVLLGGGILLRGVAPITFALGTRVLLGGEGRRREYAVVNVDGDVVTLHCTETNDTQYAKVIRS